jgi:hypothetical protein
MNTQSSPHPALEVLSLYASGDLPFVSQLRAGAHVKECAACEQQVLAFRGARVELRREATSQILTGYEAIADWQTLEGDMLGNIRVGVAAARCIDKVGRSKKWFAGVVWAAGMILLFVAGWLSRVPPDDNQRIWAALRRTVGLDQPPFYGTVVRSTPDGIAVRTQSATLTILHPQSAVISMSSPSSVTARYVDDDSGQVTITSVYGQ